jgi:hypothetical protein
MSAKAAGISYEQLCLMLLASARLDAPIASSRLDAPAAPAAAGG